MSRYLKADPGVQFRNKKVFTDSGTLTFPGTATTAKSLCLVEEATHVRHI